MRDAREFSRLCNVLRRGAFDDEPTQPVPDAARLVALGGAYGVEGIAARGAGALDDTLRVRSVANSLTLEKTYRAASGALAASGIPFVLWKGLLADASWFGGRGLRHAGDVDLIVRQEDEATSIAVLETAGFKRRIRPRTGLAERMSKARIFSMPDPGSTFLDVHVRPLNSPPFKASSREVIEQRRVTGTSLGALPTPRPEHLLALLAGNLAGGLLSGHVRLCLDAAALMRTSTIDTPILLDVARRWRVGNALWGMLRFTSERFGVAPPNGVLERLRPAAALRWQVERAFGVSSAPWEPATRWHGLVGIDWPLASRPLWILEKPARAGLRRLAEHIGQGWSIHA